MVAMDEIPKTYTEVTTCGDQDEWKKEIASELKSRIANRTWKRIPKLDHQRPIGCCWVFALKRDKKGRVIWYNAPLAAKGSHGIIYEETYSPISLPKLRVWIQAGITGMEPNDLQVSQAHGN
ncbi:unnamed protein product [Phytophthora fragariaefolia]|uniref:Unnamed protein product n=1 Tax=Phytophthora fragariaefolia TaxID=1490495 RepID=A0A9W6XT14_9STRA|nr:unnamed protein product [Phytophthora fragariaefolia]